MSLLITEACAAALVGVNSVVGVTAVVDVPTDTSSINWYTFKKLAAHNSSAWLA